MLVDDDSEPRALRFPDDVVELGKPGRVEMVLRVHELERLQVHADEIEARLADLAEVPPLEAPLARVGPIGIVAEHVDAPAERLIASV